MLKMVPVPVRQKPWDETSPFTGTGMHSKQVTTLMLGVPWRRLAVLLLMAFAGGCASERSIREADAGRALDDVAAGVSGSACGSSS